MENQTQELVIIDPKEYGLEKTQAEKMTSGLVTVLSERKVLEEVYNSVIVKELNAETFKEARELRLKVQKNRTTGIEAWHKTNKAFYLAGGRFVDAYKNKEIIVNEQMEAKLLEIEKYEQKLEADRKDKLKSDRLELLLPYEVDVQFVSIEEMTEDQFTGFLANNKLSFETKKENDRLAELARIETEKKAEQERADSLRLEAERIEAQRIENERLKKEAEQREKELESERKRLAAEQAKKESIRKVRFSEMQPMAIMFRDFQGVIELPEDEYQKQLADHKIGYEQHLEFQREQELNRLAEAEKLRIKELRDIEESAKLKAKKEIEQKEKARIEAEENEKIAKEKAALLAPDKEKVRKLYDELLAIEMPEVQSEEAKAIIKLVSESIEIIRKEIIKESKKLI